MTEEKKKQIKICSGLTSLLLIAIISIISVMMFSADYSAIIRTSEKKYFRARNLFICGNVMISMKGAETSNNMRFTSEEDDYSLSILSMSEIGLIHIIPEAAEDIDGDLAAPSKYLGRYSVEVQGHIGTLYLKATRKRVYGTIRFPKWGTGAYQRLKAVKIKNGSISFIRSANSVEETRRLGANRYFTQRFYGKYSSSGRTIKGRFTNAR